MTKTVNVTKRYKIEFDGSDEAYMDLAEEIAKDWLNQGPLDSRDLGDATGVFLTYIDLEGEDTIIFRRENLLVTITTDWDLFNWS